MAVWSRLFSGIFGVGVGIAAADAVQPVVEVARQEAWQANANRVLTPGQLAALLAQGLVSPGTAVDHAERSGFDADKLAALAQLELHAPDVAAALHMLRRQHITPALFRHALRKAGIEPQYDEAYLEERHLPLTPADLANAVQQGFIPGAGILAGDTGGTRGITPPVEEVALDTLAEFEAGALDRDHAAVLAQLVGLPPGVMELLDMWNRGIITEEAVERGIREGHTKTKWTSALKELRHFLLSPADLAGLRLRGWIDRATANELGELRGASPEVMDYLYLNRGRPATTHQAFLGFRRGGRYIGEQLDNRATFERSIRQSDIRPEWADLLWAQRHSYPSLFQLNRLVAAGAFTSARAAEILYRVGWEQQDIDAMVAFWTTAPAAAATKWADRARSRLFTVAHDEYLDASIDDAEALAALAEVGAGDAEAATIIGLWQRERELFRRELTPTQLKKLYVKGLRSEAETLDALDAMGYDPGDAADFLAS